MTTLLGSGAGMASTFPTGRQHTPSVSLLVAIVLHPILVLLHLGLHELALRDGQLAGSLQRLLQLLRVRDLGLGLLVCFPAVHHAARLDPRVVHLKRLMPQ